MTTNDPHNGSPEPLDWANEPECLALSPKAVADIMRLVDDPPEPSEALRALMRLPVR